MMTKQEVERLFRAELAALLRKWDAEIEADDHYQGYPECGQDIRIEVHIPGVWDENHDEVREYALFDLGTYITGDDARERSET